MSGVLTCLGDGWGPLVFAKKTDNSSLCFCFPGQNFITHTQDMALLSRVPLTSGSLPAPTPCLIKASLSLPSAYSIPLVQILSYLLCFHSNEKASTSPVGLKDPVEANKKRVFLAYPDV